MTVNLTGRAQKIKRLDVWLTDTSGKQYNIEIQNTGGIYRMTVEDEIRYETRKETEARVRAEAETIETLKALRNMGISIETLAKATGRPASDIRSY